MQPRQGGPCSPISRFCASGRTGSFFLSQTISLLGTAIAPIALAFAVLDAPGGSASELGFILAARALSQVVFVLAGGVLADRLPGSG